MEAIYPRNDVKIASDERSSGKKQKKKTILAMTKT
jgi:hypothetical protein